MILISILITIVCLLLIGVVLIQNSKGGGLSSSFGQGNQVMGVRKTTDFLEKATWGLAIGLLTLCLASAATIGGADEAGIKESKIQNQINNVQLPQQETQQQPVSTPAQ
jgi:preprotein translocase subunit SecG